MSDSRMRNSILNAKVNVLFYLLALVLSFFSRKIFIENLGVDFLGLVGTIQGVMGYINLVEMGFGTTIAYLLYKPLLKKERGDINEIVTALGYVYKKIGLIVLVISVGFGAIIPSFFANSGVSLLIVYAVFVAFTASSLLGYFINYKQSLLAADQKNYIIVICYQSITIAKMITQIAVAIQTRNPFIWAIVELAYGVVFSLILNRKIKKVYPWLETQICKGRDILRKHPNIITNAKRVFIHRIGAVIQWQSAPLLIYALVNLNTVALYGNYSVIIDKATQFFSKMLENTAASVGNLIAEGDNLKSLGIFCELLDLRIWIGGVLVFCGFIFIEPFISLWIGSQYILGKAILILMLSNVYLNLLRECVGQFITGYGLFQDVWSPIVEAAINLVCSLILGFAYGLPGVLSGPLASHICISLLWKPYFLFTRGFKCPTWRFYTIITTALLIQLASAIAIYMLNNMISPEVTKSNITLSALLGCTMSAAFAVISFIGLYIIHPSARSLFKRCINIRYEH